MAVQTAPSSSTRTHSRSALVDRILPLFRPLLSHARVELRAHEALGEIPPGEISPEEIVDEALLQALDHAGEAPDDALYPWLRRFVRRAIERAARAGRRRRREVSLETPIGTQWPNDDSHGPPRRLVDILPDPTSPIPEEVVESRELQQELARMLSQLPRSWREPFLLRYRDGLPVPKIAKLEGVPPEVVRRRIELAREALRAMLADEYEEMRVPPPNESLFKAIERVEPTPEDIERQRQRLERAAA
jgi:RNA polymerase sigma factor (sigma-70 family)